MTVEAAVTIEVTEVGRNALRVARIIAEYRDRYLAL